MDRYKIGTYLKALRRFETYVWLGLVIVLTFMVTSLGWWLVNGRPTSLPITTLQGFFVTEEVKPESTPVPTPQPVQEKTHVVQPGESLWMLASRWFGDGSTYLQIMTENNLTSDQLEVGQVLKVPPTIEFNKLGTSEVKQEQVQLQAKHYTVQPGDSLWKIAEHNLGSGFKWVDLYQETHNKIVVGGNPNLIYPGQTLVLTQ